MSGGRLERLRDWTVRLGVPVAVVVAVMAVFFGEQLGIDHEVSLLTPAAVRGEALPVRAVVLGGRSRPAGPQILSLPVDVSLLAADGRVLVTRRLPASPAGGADGSVPIPADAPDSVVLRAIARLDGRGVATASRRFDLRRPARPEALLGRVAHETAHFSLGPIELTFEGPAPSVLEPRVVGGACVPEAPCEIVVHVGAPAARVRFAPSATITPGAALDEATEGLARLELTVHGPEAQVELEALAGERVVARRAIRLPVALATPGLVVEDRARVAPGRAPALRVLVLGDRPGVIVDAYAGGRWRATGSVAPRDGPFAAPIALEPGVHLLQVHTDPFSSSRAATRLVATRDVPAADALRALAALGGDPPEAIPPGPDELRFAWSAASIEAGHYELPAPVRGYEADRAALEARQRTLRVAALAAMALGLLVLVVVFLRRGVGAALEAQRVMEATGDPELASARHRRRTLLSALALVGTMLLAFLAAGAMIVARARLLE